VSTPVKKYAGAILVLLGSVGWLASFALVIEKLRHLEKPTEQLTCSVNPFLTCGPAMDSWQGSLLGFPNPILGVAGFVAPIAFGAALLAGATVARWFRLTFALGVSGGMTFIVWLIAQTIVSIGALCPYCLIVWAVMIPLTIVGVSLAIANDVRHEGARPNAVTRSLVLVWLWPISIVAYATVFAILIANFPFLGPFLFG
jgi:uncharacterized membrane protein